MKLMNYLYSTLCFLYMDLNHELLKSEDFKSSMFTISSYKIYIFNTRLLMLKLDQTIEDVVKDADSALKEDMLKTASMIIVFMLTALVVNDFICVDSSTTSTHWNKSASELLTTNASVVISEDRPFSFLLLIFIMLAIEGIMK